MYADPQRLAELFAALQQTGEMTQELIALVEQIAHGVSERFPPTPPITPDDISQELLLRVWRKHDLVDIEGNVFAWLTTVAANLIRRSRRDRFEPITDELAATLSERRIPTPAKMTTAPPKILEARAIFAKRYAHLLPVVHRLRQEGLSLAKIADRLNAYGYRTARGGKWWAMYVHDLLKFEHAETKLRTSHRKDKMKIVHLGTAISVVMAELDEAGDVVRRIPLNMEVPKVNTDSWAEALKQIEAAKAQLSNPAPAKEE